MGTRCTLRGRPSGVDARIEQVRPLLEPGNVPEELADRKFLLLVDRLSGAAIAVALFDSEEAMRRADAVLNAGPGHAGYPLGG